MEIASIGGRRAFPRSKITVARIICSELPHPRFRRAVGGRLGGKACRADTVDGIVTVGILHFATYYRVEGHYTLRDICGRQGTQVRCVESGTAGCSIAHGIVCVGTSRAVGILPAEQYGLSIYALSGDGDLHVGTVEMWRYDRPSGAGGLHRDCSNVRARTALKWSQDVTSGFDRAEEVGPCTNMGPRLCL